MMDGFKDFDNNFWHIFPGELDLVERQEVRIGAIFGLTFDDLCDAEDDALAIANEEAPNVKNLFSDLSNFIGRCKMQALVTKICELKNLNEEDFSIEVSGLGVDVYYKNERL